MVIIVGAGLSGLLIAYHLENNGIPYKILEARERVGGRIHTINGVLDTPIEMGATWFHNQHRHLLSLLNELELPYYEQYMEGTTFFQQNRNAPPEQINIPQGETSYRLEGGSSRLINTLNSKLSKERVLLNQPVKEIIKTSTRDTKFGQRPWRKTPQGGITF